MSALIRRLENQTTTGGLQPSAPIEDWRPAARLHIVHVTEAPLGGVLAYLQEVISAQAGSPEVEAVYAVVPEINAAALRSIGNTKITVRAFQHKRGSLSGLVGLARETVRLVRQVRPDILHIHSTIAGGVVRICAPGFRPRPKIVYCPHGWAFRVGASNLPPRCVALMERLLALATDSITCVSDQERQDAIGANLPPRKCVVIQNGIAEIAAVGDTCRRERRPRTGKLKVLFVGRFDYLKGFDLYLDVLRRLGDEVEGIVVGDYIVNKAQPLPMPGNVTHLGWRSREDLLRLYEEADLLLMPSRAEGLPYAALEAMRAQLPVFGSRVGGLPELVVDGVTGRLFASSRPEEIAHMIRSTSREVLTAYGERGHARFLEQFTARRMNREVLDLYQTLILGRTSSCDAAAGCREALGA